MNAQLVALLAVAASVAISGTAGAEVLPVVRAGGGYVPSHGGREVTIGGGVLYMGSERGAIADLAFDYRGSDGKVLSLGGGVVLPMGNDLGLILAPKFLVGSVDDATAWGLRGCVVVTWAALLYAEVGYDYLWKDPTAEGSVRISAGINLALPLWIPEAAIR